MLGSAWRPHTEPAATRAVDLPASAGPTSMMAGCSNSSIAATGPTDEREAQQQLHEGVADGKAGDFLPAGQGAAGAVAAPGNREIRRWRFRGRVAPGRAALGQPGQTLRRHQSQRVQRHVHADVRLAAPPHLDPAFPAPGITTRRWSAPAPGGTRRRPSGKNHAGCGRRRRGSAAANPAARASRRRPQVGVEPGVAQRADFGAHGGGVRQPGLRQLPQNAADGGPVLPHRHEPRAAGQLVPRPIEEAGAEAGHRRQFQPGRQRFAQQPTAEAILAVGKFGQRAAPRAGGNAPRARARGIASFSPLRVRKPAKTNTCHRHGTHRSPRTQALLTDD
jgi:hypothetical protein